MGFEPTVRLPAHRFSRPARSTTLAPLREHERVGRGGRHLLDLGGSDLVEFRFHGVQLPGIVVEQCERCQQVELAQAGELLDDIVQVRPQLDLGPGERRRVAAMAVSLHLPFGVWREIR